MSRQAAGGATWGESGDFEVTEICLALMTRYCDRNAGGKTAVPPIAVRDANGDACKYGVALIRSGASFGHQFPVGSGPWQTVARNLPRSQLVAVPIVNDDDRQPEESRPCRYYTA